MNAMRMQRSKNMVIKLGTLSIWSLHSIGLYFNWWGHCILQALNWSAATYWGQEYSQTINWLRYYLSFALLCCDIMYICGSRSSVHHAVLGPLDLSVVLAESRLTITQTCTAYMFSFSFCFVHRLILQLIHKIAGSGHKSGPKEGLYNWTGET